MTDADGFEYYAYILVYFDDILLIMKYPKDALAQIQESFTVKPSSIEEPKSYPGADINKIYYSDGSYGWTMVDETYVTQAIKNLKKRMATEGFEYNKKLSDKKYSPQQPLSNIHYLPDMDVTDECSDSKIQFFQILLEFCDGQSNKAELIFLMNYMCYPVICNNQGLVTWFKRFIFSNTLTNIRRMSLIFNRQVIMLNIHH